MNFSSFNLGTNLLDTLKSNHIIDTTEIQTSSLPILLKGGSGILVAPTGTGKTLCYVLPIINNIDFTNTNLEAIIISPTKELARQIYSNLLIYCQCDSRIKCNLLVGNEDIAKQENKLRASKPKIIVGTIQRVLDLISKGVISKKIKTIVFDEADMLLDSGFLLTTEKLLNIVNSFDLQKILCSATLHESFANKLKKQLANCKVISTSTSI
jgi:ATP-dependent RNA helicase CshB